jgi:type IX secretion system PorP/SprF family membrane protein
MKKVVSIIVLIMSVYWVKGQAKSSYSQYVLNNYILNPAVAGIENYTDVKISTRNQWTGINGAPVTTYISMHAPINKSDYRTNATSFATPEVNPRGNQYWGDYSSKADPHHGIGLIMLNDRAGYINKWNLTATYAYHRPISEKTTLAVGFNAGIFGINIDKSKATFSDGQPDLAFGLATGNNNIRQIKPEIGGGLWLYSARYFAGISVLNIIPGKAKFTDADKYGTYYTPNFFATGGYRIAMGDDFSLIPSVMLQFWEPQLFGGHVNAKMQYLDKAWIGASYRHSNFLKGYSAMAGFYLSSLMNVSYSYEVATDARLRVYTGNTHEFMIGFTLNNRYKDVCPRNIF